MAEPISSRVDAHGVALNVYYLPGGAAAASGPPIVMLHGMRDVGLSLMPIARRLAELRPVYLMDLRGHGHSDRPGNYAMAQFVYDLHCVVESLAGGPVVLFGHSLGGQIACRFAAMFPRLVDAAIIVEGLGPPDRASAQDPGLGLQREGQHLLTTLAIEAKQRPLPSVEFAAERLLANNPRLAPDRALQLATQGTDRDDAGELHWAFDPRASAAFVGLDPRDSSRFWPHVRCPTAVICGALAAEYWGRAVAPAPPSAGASADDGGWDGSFAPRELEARVGQFPDAELVMLAGAGHMVHFDEPDRLAEAAVDFLRRRL